MSVLRTISLLLIVFCLAVAGLGCGGAKAVRGDDVAGLDHQAMSTGLDRRDLQKMAEENLKALQSSGAARIWQDEGRPSVAVMPISWGPVP